MIILGTSNDTAGHLGGVVEGRQSWNCDSCLQEIREVESIQTAICTLNYEHNERSSSSTRREQNIIT